MSDERDMNNEPTTESGTEVLAKGIVELTERLEKEKRSKSLTEIKLDHSNKVSFPGFKYLFEALDETILVSVDIFKSGYECKECHGTGKVETGCICTEHDRPGYRYSSQQITAISQSLSEEIAHARESVLCPICEGNGERTIKTCPTCEGKGGMLVLPETSKSLPTTGVVVSMGSNVPKDCGFRIGDRILFGPYAGSLIPTKAGSMFKMMDYTAAKVRIEGGEDLAAFDFVIQESD